MAGERESRQAQGLRAHTSTERNEESSESVLSLEAPPCSDLPVSGSGQHICLAGSPNSTGGGEASQANPSDFTHDESFSRPAFLCSREVYILLCLALLSTSAVWVLIILWSYPGDNVQGNERSDLHRSVDIDQLRSIALAPYGALLRYSLWHVPVASPFCEKTVPGLKVPTLTANILGTLLYSLSASYGTSPVAGLYAHAFQEGDRHTQERSSVQQVLLFRISSCLTFLLRGTVRPFLFLLP